MSAQDKFYHLACRILSLNPDERGKISGEAIVRGAEMLKQFCSENETEVYVGLRNKVSQLEEMICDISEIVNRQD